MRKLIIALALLSSVAHPQIVNPGGGSGGGPTFAPSAYSPSTAYTTGQSAIYNGTVYTAIAGSTGTLPGSNSSIWAPITAGPVPNLFNYGLQIYGDSTTTQYGASAARYTIGGILGRDVPGRVQAKGTVGDYATGVVTRMTTAFQPRYGQLPLVTLENGINEANAVGASAGGLSNFTLANNAFIRYASIMPTGSYTMASSATPTGTWAASTLFMPISYGTSIAYLNGTPRTTITNGSTLTWTMNTTAIGTGSTGSVGIRYQVSCSYAGTFTLTLNGTALTSSNTGTTTFSTGCPSTAISGVTEFEETFQGNTTGNNVLALTVTSATAAGNTVTVEMADQVPTGVATSMPYLFMQGVIKEQADANSAATAAYNTAMFNLYTAAKATGLSNLIFVDVRGGNPGAGNIAADFINCTTCGGQPGGLHLGDSGQLKLAQTYETSAAALGFSLFYPGIGATSQQTFNAPQMYSSVAVSDYSQDLFVNPYGTQSTLATDRLPGLCHFSGNNSDPEQGCQASTRFEYDQKHAKFAVKIMSNLAMCMGQQGSTAASDSCESYYELQGQLGINHRGWYFGTAMHIGSLGPTQGSYTNHSLFIDGQGLISTGTGTAVADMTAFDTTAITNQVITLPACTVQAGAVFSGYTIWFWKQSADYNGTSFASALGTETINGVAATYNIPSVAPFSLIQAQCMPSASTTSKWYISTTKTVVTNSLRTGVVANTDLAGSITMTGGTGTYTFTGTYANAPVCTASDTTAIAAVRVSATTTVLTLTGTSGDVANFQCVGRN